MDSALELGLVAVSVLTGCVRLQADDFEAAIQQATITDTDSALPSLYTQLLPTVLLLMYSGAALRYAGSLPHASATTWRMLECYWAVLLYALMQTQSAGDDNLHED